MSDVKYIISGLGTDKMTKPVFLIDCPHTYKQSRTRTERERAQLLCPPITIIGQKPTIVTPGATLPIQATTQQNTIDVIYTLSGVG